MQKKFAIIIGVAVLIVICFIWGNSVLSPEVSGKISAAVGDVMADILGKGDSATTVGGLSIRKLGHFFEYAVLGIFFPLFLTCFVKAMPFRTTLIVSAGLAVPLIDETIQIFSGRGSSLRDVWIDIAGYAVGCAVIHLVLIIVWTFVSNSKNQQ